MCICNCNYMCVSARRQPMGVPRGEGKKESRRKCDVQGASHSYCVTMGPISVFPSRKMQRPQSKCISYFL